MQYLLIICHDSSFAPTEDLVADILAWETQTERRGMRKAGNPLRPPSEAVTVRVRKGQVVRTDGPFSGAEEQMAAYELLECASLEDAVAVASGHPMAAAATVEVRPVWEDLG